MSALEEIRKMYDGPIEVFCDALQRFHTCLNDIKGILKCFGGPQVPRYIFKNTNLSVFTIFMAYPVSNRKKSLWRSHHTCTIYDSKPLYILVYSPCSLLILLCPSNNCFRHAP